MVHKATSVTVSLTLDLPTVVFLDDYCFYRSLGRSASVRELIQLARAYLALQKSELAEKVDVSLQKPGLSSQKRGRKATKKADLNLGVMYPRSGK